MKPFASRTHEEMKDVLRNPNESGPEIHYYMIRGGSEKKNITVWEPGKIGDEYIKAYGHYHTFDFEETYTIIAGEGIIIMQQHGSDVAGQPVFDEVTAFRALRVKTGQSVTIPPRMGHLMVNTGKSWLVTSDDSPVSLDNKTESAQTPTHADYSPFKILRGAAYYVIDANGEPVLIKNPLYKSVPEATIE